MIKAEHKKWAKLIFDVYLERLLKANFNRFILVNDLPKIPENESIIITPNHFSWWDGFFIYFLMKKYSNKKFHIMMLEEQLKHYWFFQKLGAFSIKIENPKSIISTFNYTKELLADSKNMVIIYPQGEIEDYNKRPVTLKKGLHNILKDKESKVSVLQIGFKIYYGQGKNPDVVARFGELLSAENLSSNYMLYGETFRTNLDLLDQYHFYNSNAASFRNIFNK